MTHIFPGIIYLFSLMLSFSCSSGIVKADKDSTKIPFGDPFILLHENKYYAYGTHSADGIEVYVSDDLLSWEVPAGVKNGLALHKEDVWGDRWFWAPEVYYVNEQFYMYFSADEHICVATSNSPLGPFVQQEKKPMFETEKAIDNSFFIDGDGIPYLFFDRFNDGLNIWVVELEENFLDIKQETMQKCLNVSQDWEEVWPRVNEGAFVIKHDNKYFMTYSANSYESPYYGIGFATADKVTGPWTKYDKNPIFQMPGELVGVGHSALFNDKIGDLRIVFHAHNSNEKIHPRNMYISTVSFKKVGTENIMSIDENYLIPMFKD